MLSATVPTKLAETSVAVADRWWRRPHGKEFSFVDGGMRPGSVPATSAAEFAAPSEVPGLISPEW